MISYFYMVKTLVTGYDIHLLCALCAVKAAHVTLLTAFLRQDALKVTVQFERCFRLMEHISVVSCLTLKTYISLESLLNSLNHCLIYIW